METNQKQAALLQRYLLGELDELNRLGSDEAPRSREALVEEVRSYLEDAYLEGYAGTYYKLGIPLITAGIGRLSLSAVMALTAGETFADRIRSLPEGYAQWELDRIVATEGHRVYVNGQTDAAEALQSTGRLLMKRWDATLDGKTRETHRLLDGTLLRLEERFVTVNGSALSPGHFGIEAEDISCRCILEILEY